MHFIQSITSCMGGYGIHSFIFCLSGYCENVNRPGDHVVVVFGAEYKVSFMRELSLIFKTFLALLLHVLGFLNVFLFFFFGKFNAEILKTKITQSTNQKALKTAGFVFHIFSQSFPYSLSLSHKSLWILFTLQSWIFKSRFYDFSPLTLTHFS